MSPFGYPSLKTPEQLAQEYNQIMQQYQNMYRNIAPGMSNINTSPNTNNINNYANQNAVSSSGDYKIIEKYSEVENTPTRLDGTASLFFDFDNMVFWSKKFVNGQHAIQSYKFMPINTNADVSTSQTVEEQAAEENNSSDVNKILQDILARLSALEESKHRAGRTSKKVNLIEGDLVDESK